MQPVAYRSRPPFADQVRQPAAQRFHRRLPPPRIGDVVDPDALLCVAQQVVPRLDLRRFINRIRGRRCVESRHRISDPLDMLIVPVKSQRSVRKVLDHNPRQIVSAERFTRRVQLRDYSLLIIALESARPHPLALHHRQLDDDRDFLSIVETKMGRTRRRPASLPVRLEPRDGTEPPLARLGQLIGQPRRQPVGTARKWAGRAAAHNPDSHGLVIKPRVPHRQGQSTGPTCLDSLRPRVVVIYALRPDRPPVHEKSLPRETSGGASGGEGGGERLEHLLA